MVQVVATVRRDAAYPKVAGGFDVSTHFVLLSFLSCFALELEVCSRGTLSVYMNGLVS